MVLNDHHDQKQNGQAKPKVGALAYQAAMAMPLRQRCRGANTGCSFGADQTWRN